MKMRNQYSKKRTIASTLPLLLAISLSPLGLAQTTWDGGGSDNRWSTPENWIGDAAPTSSQTTQVQLQGSVNTNIDIDSAFTLQRITVNAGASSATLSGSDLTLHGDSTDTGLTIRNLSSNLLTVNNNVTLTNGSGFFASGGNITFNGDIDLNGKILRILAGGGRTFTLTSSISGTTAGTGLAFNNGGSFIVTGSSSYVANTSVWKATVEVGNSHAFGSSANVITLGANADENYNSKILTSGSGVTIANNLRIITNTNASRTNTYTLGGKQTSGTSVFSGNLTMGSVSQAAMGLTLTSAAGGRVDFTGEFSRASGATGSGDSVTKTGGGIVTLAGSSYTYNGATNVDEGTLLVNGTLAAGGAAVTVKAGATLGGYGGTISRDVNLLSGSTLEVGDNAAGRAGLLSINGNLSLADNTTVKFDLAGTQSASDRLAIDGSVTLGDSITFDLSALEALSVSEYTLLSATAGFIGNPSEILFTGYDFSAANYQLSITSDRISLAIPEPNFAALGGAGLLAAYLATRPRRTRKH